MNRTNKKANVESSGLTPEQVAQVFTNYITGIEKLFDEHAIESARSMIEIYKREFGIDLVAKNQNAEALLTEFNRRHLGNLLAKATERFIEICQKN